MNLEERSIAGAVVVSLEGRLDGISGPDLEAKVSSIARRGSPRVVLDCARVRYVSSAGLRALLVCARSCRKGGGDLTIAALPPNCRTVLEMSGLLSILDCHDTSEAALTAPKRTSSPAPEAPSQAERETAMAIHERTAGPALVVSLDGRLDGVTAVDLEARIRTLIERGHTRIVLDCERMTYVSSAGLRAFLVSARNCRQKDGKLVIAAMQPDCRATLQMSGFPSVIDCHETSSAAIDALT